MILSVMREVKNFFAVTKIEGDYVIENKSITLPNDSFIAGQYVAITGSILNNGVYKLPDDSLILSNLPANETFSGFIFSLAPPPDFLTLVDEITRFENDSNKIGATGIISERFENYSWTAATDSTGAVLTWNAIFRRQLNKFRCMFSEVNL